MWSCELKNDYKSTYILHNKFFPLTRTNKLRELTDLHERYLRNKRNVTFRQYIKVKKLNLCLLYTSPSPRDRQKSRMPSSA